MNDGAEEPTLGFAPEELCGQQSTASFSGPRPGRNRRSRPTFRFGSDARTGEDWVVPSLSEVLPADHFACLLLPLVEEVLGPTLRSRQLTWGGFPYDPVRTFAIILYALILGERSSRRMEELCAYDVRFWFLSGGTRPDHTTLCRFRRSLDENQNLDLLMLLVVEKAAEIGLLKGKNVVVDGTKMPTSASQWRQYLKQTETSDKEEPPNPPVEPPPVEEKAAKPKPKCKPCSDKDARTMKTTHGEFVVGYNLQIAQDMSSGLVVGAEATNKANDSSALNDLLEATLSQSKVVPKRMVADKGYHSSDNFETLDKAGIKSYIVPKKVLPPPFKPDEDGVLRCIAGHATTCIHTKKDGNDYTTYRVNRCRNCPLMKECGKKGKSHQREMNVRSDEHRLANERNRRRCQSAAGKELVKKRGETIERTNARIKRDYRMRRLVLPGLDGARLELLIACIALNLEMILKALRRSFLLLWAVLNAFYCIIFSQTQKSTFRVVLSLQ